MKKFISKRVSLQMSYSPGGRWVTERLSSANGSENGHVSPNPAYSTSRLGGPLGMPQNYAVDEMEDYEYQMHEHHSTSYQQGNSRINETTSDNVKRILLFKMTAYGTSTRRRRPKIVLSISNTHRA